MPGHGIASLQRRYKARSRHQNTKPISFRQMSGAAIEVRRGLAACLYRSVVVLLIPGDAFTYQHRIKVNSSSHRRLPLQSSDAVCHGLPGNCSLFSKLREAAEFASSFSTAIPDQLQLLIGCNAICWRTFCLLCCPVVLGSETSTACGRFRKLRLTLSETTRNCHSLPPFQEKEMAGRLWTTHWLNRYAQQQLHD